MIVMTENKRFIIIDETPLGTHTHIWDKQKKNNQKTGDELWLGEVVGMLNEGTVIVEENKHLKQRQESLHKTIASLDECQKGQSHYINQLVKENKQLKQQCKDFMEMLDDMNIAYLLNDDLEYILGLTDYDKWVKKQTKRGKEL